MLTACKKCNAVVFKLSLSYSVTVIRMDNRIQKLNGYMESCRDEIIALISDNEIAEEAQKWNHYQRVIDNALDIIQDYISKQSVFKVDEQTTAGSAEDKQ